MSALPYTLDFVKVCEACGEVVCVNKRACDDALENIEDMRRQDQDVADYEFARERAAEWKLDRGNE